MIKTWKQWMFILNVRTDILFVLQISRHQAQSRVSLRISRKNIWITIILLYYSWQNVHRSYSVIKFGCFSVLFYEVISFFGRSFSSLPSYLDYSWMRRKQKTSIFLSFYKQWLVFGIYLITQLGNNLHLRIQEIPNNQKAINLIGLLRNILCDTLTQVKPLGALAHNKVLESSEMEVIGNKAYRKTSSISHTLVDNKIVDHSDVVGASPVGAAPNTSSFST